MFAPAAPPRSVPNILLDRFEIPPFLLPLYQAAGVEYGVRWEILAAINSIETDYGRNLNVSSAGALGWMQFMPATWEMYGVDANGDGVKDPYNPVDAIFAAARYLKAAGAGDSLRRAIWAYNHADWYVNDVIGRAEAISALPDEVVASLSGLTLGRFPVAAHATYADRISTKSARASGPNASIPVAGESDRSGMRIYASAGSPVVAVQDGIVVGLGETERLGKFVRLRDAYGNRYVYGHLAKVAENHPVPRKRSTSSRAIRRELGLDGKDPKPARAATAGHRGPEAPVATPSAPAPARLRRGWTAPRAVTIASIGEGLPLPAGVTSFESWFSQPYTLDPDDVVLKPLTKGSRVIGGTILGRIGRASLERDGTPRDADRRAERTIAGAEGVERAPHLWFEIRPAGSKTPRVDPKPILDGWRLLSATAVYRAKSSLRERHRQPEQAQRRPDPADEQGAAPAARAREPRHRDLRVRPPGHPRGHRRPPRARRARVPGRQGHEPDGHEPALRPRLLHQAAATSRITPTARRSTSPRSTARRSSATRARDRSPTRRCARS